jgi:hypothetical protein
MDDVPMMDGSVSFQSNDVRGAQNSLFLFYNNKSATADGTRGESE